MWLSQQLSAPVGGKGGLSTGKVTIAEDKAAVMLEGERRELAIACPSAVRWAPKLGDEVLVFTSDEGERFIVGIVEESSELPGQGELLLKSGSCSIHVGSGGVKVSGDMSVSGRLVVNGVDILSAIEALQASL